MHKVAQWLVNLPQEGAGFPPPRWIVAPGKHTIADYELILTHNLWYTMCYRPHLKIANCQRERSAPHDSRVLIIWCYNALSRVMRICGETKASDRNEVQVCIFQGSGGCHHHTTPHHTKYIYLDMRWNFILLNISCAYKTPCIYEYDNHKQNS